MLASLLPVGGELPGEGQFLPMHWGGAAWESYIRQEKSRLAEPHSYKGRRGWEFWKPLLEEKGVGGDFEDWTSCAKRFEIYYLRNKEVI